MWQSHTTQFSHIAWSYSSAINFDWNLEPINHEQGFLFTKPTGAVQIGRVKKEKAQVYAQELEFAEIINNNVHRKIFAFWAHKFAWKKCMLLTTITWCCTVVDWPWVVGRLLNVPATCEWISGTDLLPHWDRSCRPNFPSHPVTVYWHRADQSQRIPYNAKHLAG